MSYSLFLRKSRFFVTVCLLASVGSGCSRSTSSEEEAEESAPPPLVAVHVVETERWQDRLNLTAELHPWSAVTVAAETAGRVVHLPVEHGDQVRKGALIARLETATAEAELARSKARLQSTLAALAQADRDLERGRALAAADQGIVSVDDVDRLLLARDTRAAEQSEAAAAVKVVEEQLADMEVRSPFSGIVSERHVEEGSWVSNGSPVVRVLDLSRLKVRASASSSDRVRLALEHTAFFHLDGRSDQRYEAELRFLGQEADAATGSFLVEAETDGDGLLPGLQGTLAVTLADHEGLLIPKTALLSSSAGHHVFVVESGTAVRKSVEVAPVDARRVEVLAGLSPGDRLVVQGQHRLGDGQAVEEHKP